ncbi:ATP-grasp domain-containing protein [Mangrovihabitans endophyticus]|uniref:ATP-grasp domain-containing protein n=1 Tax=Mangrovihabitans endophyticus TaxID=1751298 RepID=A0A8J3FMR2_9ACTN|nr:ATP-grasp domain-containing protein [Mangrovihabitans endophyticus]GGK75264.1 hypothetical protein GCM10012284_06550 [Mangrovihabitans endophyticus]
MLTRLGCEQLVLVGFSRTLLTALTDVLPPGSVLVVEEPDVAAKRDIPALARRFPAVSRVLLWEYQRDGAVAALLRAAPALTAARAVVPGIEYAVQPAAGLAAALGLPGAGERAAGIFRDKVRQRRAAARSGLRNPAYAAVTTAEEAVGFFRRAGGRCIVKPTTRQASLGVRFVAGEAEVVEAVRAAEAATEPLLVPARGIPSELLIERALDGPEYSVEALVRDSRVCFTNVTAKRVLPGPYPVELGHLVPGAPSPQLATRLAEHTSRLAAESGFAYGVLHCEWIVDEEGPALVECAARLPGDEIATLISLAYGFSFVGAYVSIMAGLRPSVCVEPRGAAAIRFLSAPPGSVREVLGLADAARAAEVHAATVSVAPGDVVRPLTSSWQRVGHVITRSVSAPAAERLSRRSAEQIAVRTEPA